MGILFDQDTVTEFYENEIYENGKAEGMKQGMKQGMEQGMMQGLEQGKLEGEKATNLRNAKRMKQKGLDVDDIAEITGLSLEDIEKL